MTVLFVTTMLPWARTTGSEVCTAAFVDALRASGRRVVVLGYHRAGDELLQAGPDDVEARELHIETRSAGLRPLLWMGGAVLTRSPYTVAKFRTRALRRRLRELIATEKPEAIVLDHARMSWVLPREGFDVPLIYVAHNVEHAMYAQSAANSRGPVALAKRREARMIEHVERRVVALADAVWTLSDDDSAALRRLGSKAAPRAFGLPPSAAVGFADGTPTEYDVGLIGSWTWKPNFAGLEWFVREVKPHLPRDVSVAIAGAGGAEVTTGLDYRGRVPDAGEFLHAARVIACPSVEGGGVQLKTLDAIATGRPVVATSIALRGLSSPPATVAAADDPADFAAALAAAARAPRADGSLAREWTAARRASFDADVADALAAVTG